MKRQLRNIIFEEIYMIPLIFIIGILPLIVYMKEIPLQGISFELFNEQSSNMDFFSYQKMIFLLSLTGSCVIITLFYILKGNFKFKIDFVNICIFAYGILAILSTLMSEHIQLSMFGFPDRYEGLFVVLAYMFLLFYTINMIKTKREIKILLKTFLFSGAIICIIGILQFLGFDILNTELIKNIIIPSQYPGDIVYNNKTSYVYSTLYNSNYVGSYIVMLLMVSITFIIINREKKYKTLYIIICILAFTLWYVCGSRAGIVGGLISFICAGILYRKRIMRYRKIVIIGVTICLIIVSGANIYKKVTDLNRFTSAYNEMTKPKGNDTRTKLQDVKVEKNSITFISQDEVLNIKMNENKLNFFDENNNKLPYIQKGNDFKFSDIRYSKYNIHIDGNAPSITIESYGLKVSFYISKEKGFQIIGNQGKVDEIVYPKVIGFEGNQRLGSSRGYIWSRTIPLLKDTIIIGHGPDTFPVYFPQKDYIGKLVILGKLDLLISKPHNMYLQIGVNTGIISLIILIILWGRYILTSIAMYINKSEYNQMDSIGAGIFIAVIAYLITGVFNDSVVCVAPVFWLLLGLGFVTNKINTRKISKNSLTEQN